MNACVPTKAQTGVADDRPPASGAQMTAHLENYRESGLIPSIPVLSPTEAQGFARRFDAMVAPKPSILPPPVFDFTTATWTKTSCGS